MPPGSCLPLVAVSGVLAGLAPGRPDGAALQALLGGSSGSASSPRLAGPGSTRWRGASRPSCPPSAGPGLPPSDCWPAPSRFSRTPGTEPRPGWTMRPNRRQDRTDDPDVDPSHRVAGRISGSGPSADHARLRLPHRPARGDGVRTHLRRRVRRRRPPGPRQPLPLRDGRGPEGHGPGRRPATACRKRDADAAGAQPRRRRPLRAACRRDLEAPCCRSTPPAGPSSSG